MAYGLLTLALAGTAQYRGWSLNKVNELKDVPKTVRDNPGAYRSHFASYFRYIGGK
jgi:hypothetical protein